MEASEPERCRNCGTPLSGEYCHACGQRSTDLRRPLWSFLQEVATDFFSLDSRVARTLWQSVRYPGSVARRYIDGERARFVPPLRLFLFGIVVTVVTGFITREDLTLAEVDDHKQTVLRSLEESLETEEDETARQALESYVKKLKRSIAGTDAASEEPARDGEDERTVAIDLGRGKVADDDDASAAVRLKFSADDDLPSWLDPLVTVAASQPGLLQERFRPWLSRIYTIMGFLTALILSAVYWRRFLAEHIVFSLYLHAVLLLGAGVTDLLKLAVGSTASLAYLVLGLTVVPLSMRRFYGGTGLATALRLFVSGFLYIVAISTSLIGALLWEAWQLQ